MYHEATKNIWHNGHPGQGNSSISPYLVVTSDILVIKIIFVFVLVLVSFHINHFYFI